MGVLDLFDDDDPAPDNAVALPQQRAERADAPTYRNHPCSVAGCGAWGCYGLMGDEIAESEWRCRAHVWPDFLPAARLSNRGVA